MLSKDRGYGVMQHPHGKGEELLLRPHPMSYSDVAWVSSRFMVTTTVNAHQLVQDKNNEDAHYWPFVRGIHGWALDSSQAAEAHKGLYIGTGPRWLGWGLLSHFLSIIYFPGFPELRRHRYLLNITFIFDKCHRSQVVQTWTWLKWLKWFKS